MRFVERFKIFFNKDDLDYSKGHIDPYEFHKIFYFVCKVYGVLDKELLPKWAFLTPIVVLFHAFFAALLFGSALIHNIYIFELSPITESGTYFILMVYKLLMISSPLNEKINFQNCWQAMKEDYTYICTSGSRYRERFFENHLWTWKANILCTIFVAFIGSGMIFSANVALIVYVLQKHSEGSSRPLPYPIYILGVDNGSTPIYEILFVFSNMCVVTHTCTYIFMLSAQLIWVRQITSKADVIIWSIQDLLIDVQPTNNVQQTVYDETIIKSRMGVIIKMHHSMYRFLEDYSAVFRKLLMFEQKSCAPVVCLTLFCSLEKLNAGKNPILLLLLCISIIIGFLIPSYMCTFLGEKVKSIGDACWDAPFWNSPGKVVRPYFILMMQRSTRPLPIQAPGFDEVTLQTFSDKMQLAYTGFNMLRQAKNET